MEKAKSLGLEVKNVVLEHVQDQKTKQSLIRVSGVWLAHLFPLLYLFWNWIPYWFYLVCLIGQFAGAVYTWKRLSKYVRSNKEVERRRSSGFGVPLLGSTPGSPRSTLAPIDENTDEIDTKDDSSDSDAVVLSRRPVMSRKLSVFDRVEESQVNPFVNSSWMITDGQRFYLSFAAVTLMPLRLLLAVASLLTVYLLGLIMTYGRKTKEDLERPFEDWRLYLGKAIQFAVRGLLFSMGFYWIPTKGEDPATRAEAPMIVCNHRSFLEPIYLISKFLPSPVGAIDHLRAPIIGSIVKAIRCITVDRSSPTSRGDVVRDIIRRCTEDSFPQVLLFPEGTTTNGTALITFKKGAFIPGVPVQPCLVKHPGSDFDPSWVFSGPSVKMLFMRVLTAPVNHMEFTFLPVYKPNAEEKKDPHLFARNVRSKMCKAMNVPVTEHSYEDVLLQKAALKSHLPPDAVVSFEMKKLRQMFDINVDTIKEQMAKFSSMDTNKTGKVTRAQFLAVFDIENSPEIEHLFHLLDRDDSGEIDFKEYLIGLGIVNTPQTQKNTETMLRLAFRMFDLKQNDNIELEDLKRVFRRAFPTFSERDYEQIFAKIDKDKSGAISWDEFKQFALSDPSYTDKFRTVLNIPASITAPSASTNKADDGDSTSKKQ